MSFDPIHFSSNPELTYRVGYYTDNQYNVRFGEFVQVEVFSSIDGARHYVNKLKEAQCEREYTIQQYSNGRWVDVIEKPTNTQSTQKSRYDRTFSYVVSTLLNNSYRVSESVKHGRIDYLRGGEGGRIRVYESGEVSGVIPACLFDKLIGSDLA